MRMKNPQLYPEQMRSYNKVNLVPENQPESLEGQPADKKGLRPSLTVVKTGSNPPTLTALAENAVVKTGSNPPTLTALAENDDNMNDDVDRAYKGKKNTAGTEVKEINRIREESKRKRIDEFNESKQTRQTKIRNQRWTSRKMLKKTWNS